MKIQEKMVKQESARSDDISLVASEPLSYGAEYLARARLGQGAFQVLVTDAYNRRCAITGERTLPVLQAAHIKPYSRTGPNRVHNGLLLRSDLHILFDEGLLTVTKDLRVEVSRRIKDEYENGKDYYALRGRRLVHVPYVPSTVLFPNYWNGTMRTSTFRSTEWAIRVCAAEGLVLSRWIRS